MSVSSAAYKPEPAASSVPTGWSPCLQARGLNLRVTTLPTPDHYTSLRADREGEVMRRADATLRRFRSKGNLTPESGDGLPPALPTPNHYNPCPPN